MSAGELDRRIVLRRAAVQTNRANEDELVWGELATVWAKREELSDVERFRAQQVGATTTTRFKIRWSRQVADLNPKDQLVDDAGLTRGISAVKPEGRREWLWITANGAADRPPDQEG
jgi:SPP1 family predicted phage head-tail adaptor